MTEGVIGDLQALIGIARASIAVLDKGHATTGDVRTDVVAMRSILNRIDNRLSIPADGEPYTATAGRTGAQIGLHRRWHVNRGESNPGCRYCNADRAAADGIDERNG